MLPRAMLYALLPQQEANCEILNSAVHFTWIVLPSLLPKGKEEQRLPLPISPIGG